MGFSKNNKFQIISIVLFIGLFFYLRNTLEVDKDFYSDMLSYSKDGEYSGVVTKKYIDSSNHNTPMLKLSNTSVSIVNKFWDKISVGDSISKHKGKYFITVYKPDGKTIRLDYKKYYDNLSGKSTEQKNQYPVQKYLVNDYERLFTAEQTSELNTILVKFDSTSQNKIVLLTVKSYNENVSFQDYVSQLGKKWHIDENNNGRTILIVFSREKRKIALTLGAGVKGISQSQTNKIISEKVIPEFKRNQYYIGIKSCINEIIKKWK
ncbi:TPM domain-containing protein [Flavobacterium sp. RHBU_3]|uniref:TPM domain-containing protein n=1 Tax=Flavobacterium sp. RHBU_3 TaxID=3391184 RepID=UPI003984F2FD